MDCGKEGFEYQTNLVPLLLVWKGISQVSISALSAQREFYLVAGLAIYCFGRGLLGSLYPISRQYCGLLLFIARLGLVCVTCALSGFSILDLKWMPEDWPYILFPLIFVSLYIKKPFLVSFLKLVKITGEVSF